MAASVIIPLLRFNLPSSAGTLNSTLIALPGIIFQGEAIPAPAGSIGLRDILIILYCGTGLFFLGRLVVSVTNILFRTAVSERAEISGTRVLISKELHASSFFHLIFIDPGQAGKADLGLIIEHESFHARLGHSLDRILAEVVLCVGWINPMTWMLRKAIVVNHEYQADNRVIEHGTDQVSYQLTILNQYIGSASITNQFSNQIKNRITMINKKYKKGSSWKGLMLIPVSIVLLFFIACGNESPVNNQDTDALDNPAASEEPGARVPGASESMEEEVFYVVEEMPQWPGSEDMADGIRTFIAQHLKYPEVAKQNSTEGKVFVTFMVTKTGKVVIPDPSILPPPANKADGSIDEVVVVAYRPLGEGPEKPNEAAIQSLKDEAVRVIGSMPDLVPGKQRGEAVNVMFTMPIIFKLK
jgi:hypothetical protein